MKSVPFYLVVIAFLFSCSIFRNNVDVNQGNVSPSSYRETLPFDHIREKVIVPVMINGKERRFIFDTGAITVISNSLYEEMQYLALGNEPFYDIHKNRDTSLVVQVRKMKLGQVSFNNIPALVYDLKALPWGCFEIDGIIGSNMLRESSVQINLQDSTLTIADHICKMDLGNARKNKMRLNKQNSPFIKLLFDQGHSDYFLFDSGSDGFVNMNRDLFLQMKDEVPVQMQRKGNGSNAMGIIGNGRRDDVYRVVLDSFGIASHSVLDPLIEVTSTRSKVGSQLFHFGKVTLDYVNQNFFFEAYQLPLVYDREESPGYGFIPVVDKNTLRVGLVWENSLVDSLGLKPNQRIIRINEYNFADSLEDAFCTLFLENALRESKEIEMIYQNHQGAYKRVKIRRKQ